MFYEAMGWLALLLNIWGNFALAKKSISGWIVRMACNAAFIIYSAYFGIWPLLVNHIIFAGVNVYGWLEWKRNTYVCGCGRKYDITHDGLNCICDLPIRVKT